MSLLSPELLTVFISPAEVVAVRRRGLRQEIADKRVVAVSTRPENSREGWEGAVQVFAELLAEFPACRKVSVIVSNHFLHYHLLPWRDDSQDREEELALAQMAFAETYGEAASRWQVRVADEAPGRSRIGAALAGGFVAALDGVATAAGARVVSVQPYLTAAINHFRRVFAADSAAWFVLHEEGRVCLALVDRGTWRWVRSTRVGDDWSERLPELLDNEVLLAGADDLPASALICAPAAGEAGVPAGTRWSFRALRLAAVANFSPASEGRFGPALLG